MPKSLYNSVYLLRDNDRAAWSICCLHWCVASRRRAGIRLLPVSCVLQGDETGVHNFCSKLSVFLSVLRWRCASMVSYLASRFGLHAGLNVRCDLGGSLSGAPAWEEGELSNTVTDLIVDGSGTLAATLLALTTREREEQLTYSKLA